MRIICLTLPNVDRSAIFFIDHAIFLSRLERLLTDYTCFMQRGMIFRYKLIELLPSGYSGF